MNKSQRIRVNPNEPDQDKHLQVRLEQDINTLEIMSLKIDTKEAYQNFNADYGVLVGRVIANNGIGVPNCKVSIFIPLNENDENNSDVVSIYPYKNPREKNNEGKRYNLLPRVSSIDPNTNAIRPQQPFGSFPTKEEILTNSTYLQVYKKYYKFSTVTNSSGDYMIFGIPVGTQTVHMSADITDIGELSMAPASMISNLGYSPNLFNSDGTRIKSSNDLDDLPNIETQEISTDIIPFWGDENLFQIGITRQDFRIKAQLNYNFVIFGSSFTDGDERMWGDNYSPQSGARPGELFRARNQVYRLSTKRLGRITEKIYYYPANVTGDDIGSEDYDTSSGIIKLDSSEYSSYKRDGDFIFIINCNRGKVITSETGEEIPVPEDYNGGIYKEFWGFMTLEYTSEDVPMNFETNIGNDVIVRPLRYKFKFPQNADVGQSFVGEGSTVNNKSSRNNSWRKQYQKFIGGRYYSIAKFHTQTALRGGSNNTDDSNFQIQDYNFADNAYFVEDSNERTNDPNWIIGTILIDDNDDQTNKMVSNWNEGGGNYFGGNWLNFTLYLPQVGFAAVRAAFIAHVRISSNMTTQSNSTTFVFDNQQEFVAGEINTKWFARSDFHPTRFIETTQDEIRYLYQNVSKKGFSDEDIEANVWNDRVGKYINATEYVPRRPDTSVLGNSGMINLNTNNIDPTYYFYKGYDTADCIDFLNEIGLL